MDGLSNIKKYGDKNALPNGVNIIFFSYRLKRTFKLRETLLNGYTVLFKPIAFSNVLFNFINPLKKW